MIFELKNLHIWVLNDRQIEFSFLIHQGDWFPGTLKVKSQNILISSPYFTYWPSAVRRMFQFLFSWSCVVVFFFWHITNNDYTGTHLNGKSTDFNYLSLKLPGCVALSELLLCASISSSVEWVRVVSTAYDYCKDYESYCISHQEHCLALCVLS